ncbi:hypothetical protein AC1031_010735 [Aphanomyces cochlioides]|nr:hypothetical protein AC1031_010735 [Aphanomyces cochlioides]
MDLVRSTTTMRTTTRVFPRSGGRECAIVTTQSKLSQLETLSGFPLSLSRFMMLPSSSAFGAHLAKRGNILNLMILSSSCAEPKDEMQESNSLPETTARRLRARFRGAVARPPPFHGGKVSSSAVGNPVKQLRVRVNAKNVGKRVGHHIGSKVGGKIGAIGGAKVGGAIGCKVAGPAGCAIGGKLGYIGGKFVGSKVGGLVGKKIGGEVAPHVERLGKKAVQKGAQLGKKVGKKVASGAKNAGRKIRSGFKRLFKKV